jgi:hypothetical protein
MTHPIINITDLSLSSASVGRDALLALSPLVGHDGMLFDAPKGLVYPLNGDRHAFFKLNRNWPFARLCIEAAVERGSVSSERTVAVGELFCGADLGAMNKLLSDTGAKIGDLVIYGAEAGPTAAWRFMSALERSEEGWIVLAVGLSRVDGSAEESAQLVSGDQPSGVKLPDDYGFRPVADLRAYNEWLKSELGKIGWDIRDVDTGLAHPVKSPDLAAALDTKLKALMLSRAEAVASWCRLTYRPKARRSDDVRLVLTVEIRSGAFFATDVEVDDWSQDRDEITRLHLTLSARDASARRLLEARGVVV